MQIRRAADADNTQLKSIFRYNLGCSSAYADWYFARCHSRSESAVAEDNGVILSTVENTPYTLMINHTPVKAGYISTVSTLPEHRGKGCARALITQTLSDMKNNGTLVCFAVPPSYKMFNKFGFRLTHQFKQYNIDMKNIPAYSMNALVERVNTDESMIVVLSGIYESFTADKNGYIIRTPQDWMLILDDLQNNFGGHVALVRGNDGSAVGYIMYIIRGREMHIYEAAYINHNAYTAVMAYIKSHATQVDTVMIKAPACDLSHLDFSDNRAAVGLYPLVASRITDVKAALELAASKGFAGNMKIQVVDRIIEENSGIYCVSQDGVSVCGDDSATADVMCDVGALTQLFLGFLSPVEAKKMNLISGDTEAMDKLFPKKDNYINMLLV